MHIHYFIYLPFKFCLFSYFLSLLYCSKQLSYYFHCTFVCIFSIPLWLFGHSLWSWCVFCCLLSFSHIICLCHFCSREPYVCLYVSYFIIPVIGVPLLSSWGMFLCTSFPFMCHVASGHWWSWFLKNLLSFVTLTSICLFTTIHLLFCHLHKHIS